MKPDGSAIEIVPLGGGDDIGQAQALLISFFQEEGFDTPPETVARNFRRMLGLDICRVFVARRGARLLGIATASLDFGIEYGWSCEVGDLYVLPAERGKGIARALIDRCAAWSRERAATTMRVTVTRHGAEAGLARFYEGLGLIDEGRGIMSVDLTRTHG